MILLIIVLSMSHSWFFVSFRDVAGEGLQSLGYNRWLIDYLLFYVPLELNKFLTYMETPPLPVKCCKI
jgi:hypothetical protein